MMKKMISMICLLLVLCTVLGGMALAEETSMIVVKEFTGETLTPMGVENVSAYSDNALRSVLDEQGNVVAQPEEKAIGFSARMFGNVYSMWGYCTPQYDAVKDITVELKASLYAFDDVNWTVKKDGFLQELHYEYSNKNVLGFMLDGQMQWIAGYEYDEAPVEYNAERGYYYKTFTFDYQDMASGVEGKVYHEWDHEMVYMSLVTHGVTYYDSVTGEELRSVNEDDCAYGTLDNLTGIVGDYHPYTDLSCGEALVNKTVPTFAVAKELELTAGEYVLQLGGELNTKVQVMAGDTVLASEIVTAAAETPAQLSFALEEDAVCKVVIEQQDTAITLSSITLLMEETSEPPAPEVTYGDLNGDEKVDAKDALNVLKIAVGKLDATDEMKLVADVTGDGEINAKDALDILKKAVGKIEFFPVELKG